jgi:hypothetical protein
MGRTRQKEKQLTRTVRPKTLRAKGNKKKAPLSGLLTYTVLPCTPSPLASLQPPLPLADELTPRRRRHLHTPTLSTMPPTPPPPIARAPGTPPLHALRRRRRCPRSCLRPPRQQAGAASPCPRLRPLPGTCAAAAAAAARGSFPRVSRPRYDLRHRCRRSRGCTYPTTEQTPATVTSHAARYVRPSLNCLPSPPSFPREISHRFFYFFF